MKLSDILKEVETKSVQGPVERAIHALHYDSRRVETNDVFFAWKGAKTDGHQYIAEVCDKGAAAVVLENPNFIDDRGPTFIEVKNARRTMADMSANFFGHPDRALRIVGVTGTNGKTTTSFILKHLISEPKSPVGLIGTVRYEIGERILPASRTTPESLDLHGLLAQMKAAGCRAAVMEVSSHALEQGRVAPIEFQVGVFTNLTQDHLDYHQTMENYFAAKVLLFANLDRATNPGVAVINADDPYGKRLIRLLRDRMRVIAYTLQGEAGAEIEATGVVSTASGTTGALRIGGETFPLALPLIGSYNAANALAAAGGALALGIAPRVIAERLRDTPQVPGRLEKFVSKDGVTAVVDYAHTDDAVRKALAALRGITGGRLIAVLGCGGNRDAVKRPLMAAAAVECADYSIFTADNPRQESVESILDHMEAGVAGKYLQSKYERLPDRRQAIARALALAQPGDIVCVAGKGHETTQETAGKFHPFDDRLVVQEFLQRRAA
ncbi:MAG TPA: UDP-N-acetylmuramoyl-L-alanyl-D-glutamate--2,6-diaminopimelate ligase [Candidatus Methylacidiphilales bacterium]|nr:UDP-N-acetylmuramoyl-L-alanyl-D-glutamate--2,6-diaminopimelate ligase [Candidatus Methylacidiphilales bacterium]